MMVDMIFVICTSKNTSFADKQTNLAKNIKLSFVPQNLWNPFFNSLPRTNKTLMSNIYQLEI